MNYAINVDHELKIIRYKHSGVIAAEDIGQAWQEFLSLGEFTQLKYNLLSDYRNAKFDILFRKIKEIVNFMFNIKDVVKGKRQALIVDDPHATAGSMLFEVNVYKEVGFIVKVFTTEKAALQWLSA